MKQWISAFKEGQNGVKSRTASQRHPSISHHSNHHHNSNHHHHHNHSHHQHSHNSNNNNENIFESSYRKLTIKHKHLSKSNESISSLQLSFKHNKSMSVKSSNILIKHNQSKSDDSDEKQQRIDNVKQQSQYYQKLHMNEFADLLSLREAALANKTNKINHTVKNLQNKTQPNNYNNIAKFKPQLNSHVNNNENNNNGMSKSKSKSNPHFVESSPSSNSTIKKQSQNLKDTSVRNSCNFFLFIEMFDIKI